MTAPDIRDVRRDAGACPRCGAGAGDGYTHCAGCRQYLKMAQRLCRARQRYPERETMEISEARTIVWKRVKDLGRSDVRTRDAWVHFLSGVDGHYEDSVALRDAKNYGTTELLEAIEAKATAAGRRWHQFARDARDAIIAREGDAHE